MIIDQIRTQIVLLKKELKSGEIGGLNQKFGHKKRVSYSYRTAQPNTLALFPTWGSQWELVVEDLPSTKVEKKIVLGKKKCLFLLLC